MSIWFLQLKEMLSELNFKNADNILPPPITDDYCGTLDECSPPQNQKKLMIMLKYIQNKEYTKDQLKAYCTFNQSTAPAKILPLEQICHYYVLVISQNLFLFQPLQKLLLCKDFLKNCKSFVKKCIRCSYFYRYQESCRSIHNYDDRLFLGIFESIY